MVELIQSEPTEVRRQLCKFFLSLAQKLLLALQAAFPGRMRRIRALKIDRPHMRRRHRTPIFFNSLIAAPHPALVNRDAERKRTKYMWLGLERYSRRGLFQAPARKGGDDVSRVNREVESQV